MYGYGYIVLLVSLHQLIHLYTRIQTSLYES